MPAVLEEIESPVPEMPIEPPALAAKMPILVPAALIGKGVTLFVNEPSTASIKSSICPALLSTSPTAIP
jgi:hypothetical protein